MIRYVSCFSGIEAASVAWKPLGWHALAFAETDPFCSAVLKWHYGAPNLGDVTAKEFPDVVAALKPDVLIGGPPCQAFSVAGLRKGLDDDRGQLSLRWVEIIHASGAAVAITENVPGWLSQNRGRSYGVFIGQLVGAAPLIPPRNAGGRWTDAGLVAGPLGRIAWRVCDARYFGVPQRRRRVFVVFCPGDGPDPAEILFEPARRRGNPAASEGAGEGTANGAPGSAGADAGGGVIAFDHIAAGSHCGHAVSDKVITALRATNDVRAAVAFGGNNTSGPIDVATACNASHTASGRRDFESETFITWNITPSNSNKDYNAREARYAQALNGTNAPSARGGDFVTHSLRAEGFDAGEDGTGRGIPLIADPLTSNEQKTWTHEGNNTFRTRNLIPASGVRRLTVTECERLQGFSDGYTAIEYRGKPAADGPRYRTLGNSMCVPVIRWLGERIEREIWSTSRIC